MVYCGYQTTDYDKIYEAKLTKTLKKFTAKPITQVCWHAGTYGEHYFVHRTLCPLELVFLRPVNLIRGVVKGKGFVRPVQVLVFLETFLENFCDMLHCMSTLYKVA